MLIQDARGRTDGQFAKTKLFYDILVKRRDAYNILIDALTETQQTGSLMILNNGNANAAIRNLGILIYYDDYKSHSLKNLCVYGFNFNKKMN